MSKSGDDSRWRRALAEGSAPRHARAAGSCWRGQQGSLSPNFTSPPRSGIVQSPLKRWRTAASPESFLLFLVVFCFGFFSWERAEGVQNMVHRSSVLSQAPPTGIPLLVMLPFCASLLDNPRVGHSSAPPSWSARPPHMERGKA